MLASSEASYYRSIPGFTWQALINSSLWQQVYSYN
jgi:hypothetical protein